ncbi:hypothetical protein PAHAL_5G210700 [Panicum hallii]|uniref:Uncharacterized protein n=1 Tax=Panicum hallii TaxID=206008 RepID=A0A2T8IKR2_9POAL|nr:hypothetical protein PAHAL_5G210700 [Panicum hallii]
MEVYKTWRCQGRIECYCLCTGRLYGYMFELIRRVKTPEPLCQASFILVTLSMLSNSIRRKFLSFCKVGLLQSPQEISGCQVSRRDGGA